MTTKDAIAVVNQALDRTTRFVRRQKRNYRVAVTRQAGSSFLINLTAQYDSIYTAALGASPVELGTINSIGGAVSSFLSPIVGWLVDRFGPKRFFVAGITLMGLSALVYGLAPTWSVIIPAMILFSIAMRLIGTGCGVICGDSLHNPDRATGQNLCNVFSSLASLVAPLAAALLITRLGGISAEGIRPLYFIKVAGFAALVVFIVVQLSEPIRAQTARGQGLRGVLDDLRQVMTHRPELGRWVVVSALGWLPFAMAGPFVQLFAHEIKGADQYVLGMMASATVALPLVFGIPMGRLADRIGRKKVIYALSPLWYVSYLLLVYAPGPWAVVLAGAFLGFYQITLIVGGAMMIELVSVDQLGRWSGLNGLFRGLVTIPGPLLAGLIWQQLGPAYVFLVPIGVDLLVRLPLLSTVPETLHGRQG